MEKEEEEQKIKGKNLLTRSNSVGHDLVITYCDIFIYFLLPHVHTEVWLMYSLLGPYTVLCTTLLKCVYKDCECELCILLICFLQIDMPGTYSILTGVSKKDAPRSNRSCFQVAAILSKSPLHCSEFLLLSLSRV